MVRSQYSARWLQPERTQRARARRSEGIFLGVPYPSLCHGKMQTDSKTIGKMEVLPSRNQTQQWKMDHLHRYIMKILVGQSPMNGGPNRKITY